jgi:hypothetical protein
LKKKKLHKKYGTNNYDSNYHDFITNSKTGLSAKKKMDYTNFTGASGNPEFFFSIKFDISAQYIFHLL